MLFASAPPCNGQDDCCDEVHPCGEAKGDCDRDSQCTDGLQCGTDNCQGSDFKSTSDCCEPIPGNEWGRIYIQFMAFQLYYRCFIKLIHINLTLVLIAAKKYKVSIYTGKWSPWSGWSVEKLGGLRTKSRQCSKEGQCQGLSQINAPASFPKISNADLSATASSIYGTAYTASKAIDGDKLNFWHAKTSNMDWLQVRAEGGILKKNQPIHSTSLLSD